ncbi:hypothetical protein H4S06_003241 [Coemansia sp. BCRC 34490]|nr:hypothetical protein H4S06_003241 [Coemansia sp. BCRC 34490]
MAERYTKLLTWRNAQLFVGGLLLTGTTGYMWLKPRMDRTAALQRRLDQVKTNMYWSMSLQHRMHLAADALPYTQHRRQVRQLSLSRTIIPEKVNAWWNGRLSEFAVWAAEPGYVGSWAGLALATIRNGATDVWAVASTAVSNSGVRTVHFAKDAIRWDTAVERIRRMWAEEKSKWTKAHMQAIEAVHPFYEQACEQQSSSRSRPRWQL